MSSEYYDASYYSLAIIIIALCASYTSKKTGIVTSSSISIVSLLFTIGASLIGGKFLLFGILIWPGSAWFGFFVGRHVRKKHGG